MDLITKFTPNMQLVILTAGIEKGGVDSDRQGHLFIFGLYSIMHMGVMVASNRR